MTRLTRRAQIWAEHLHYEPIFEAEKHPQANPPKRGFKRKLKFPYRARTAHPHALKNRVFHNPKKTESCTCAVAALCASLPRRWSACGAGPLGGTSLWHTVNRRPLGHMHVVAGDFAHEPLMGSSSKKGSHSDGSKGW